MYSPRPNFWRERSLPVEIFTVYTVWVCARDKGLGGGLQFGVVDPSYYSTNI